MNKQKLIFLALLVAALLLAWPVQAAENVQVALTPSTSELTVGDPVQLTLEVTHPAGYQVIVPKLEQAWGEFEVQGQSQTQTSPNPDDSETTRQTLTVTLFDLGTFETPALPLTISAGDGQVIEEVVPPVTLTVKPVLAEGDTTLKDIRPQVGLPLPSIWPLVLTGVLIAAVTAGGGWWLIRRRRDQVALAQAIDNRPPHQRALDELAHIESLRLPDQGRFKEHYTLVTDCLRTYIEQQFRVHAFDRTTTELKQSLSRSSLSNEHTRRLIDLFKESDYVKFAKMIPAVENARQLTDRARVWVEETRPKPELIPDESPQKPTGPNHIQADLVEVAQ